MKIRIALGVTLALASLFAFAPAVEAQEMGERAFELYAGYLVPGERELENDTTWGIRYTARHWDQFGQDDPLWAILTDASRKGGKWDLEEFFATGREEIGRTMNCPPGTVKSYLHRAIAALRESGLVDPAEVLARA